MFLKILRQILLRARKILPKDFIDESDLEDLSKSKNLEGIHFPKTTTPNPQTLTALENDATTQRQQTTTNDNKRQHLENFSELSEEEIELLAMLQQGVSAENAYFAQQIKNIVQEVCDSGAADCKKVAPGMPDASDLTEESGI